MIDANTAFVILSLLAMIGFAVMTIQILKNNKTNFSGRTLTELMIIANEQYTPADRVILFAKILDSIDWHSVDPVQRELLVRKLQSIINFLDENNEKAD